MLGPAEDAPPARLPDNPVPFKKGRQVAVRVISQFGEESTRVLTL